MRADEILTATIAELESLGLPENKKENDKTWSILQDELTGKQVKEIEAILKSDNKEKTEKIAEILENLEKENLAQTIAKLLIS